jgi:kynurenine formamidase
MTYAPVDLSVEVDEDTVGPPSTNVRVQMTRHHRGPGFWQVSSISQGIHTGTHIDTPLHVYEDGGSTSGLPLSDLCGPAALFDLTKGASEAVTADDLVATDPGLGAGDLAVLRTGWSDKMWGNFPEYYTQSPWLHESAAHWLVARRPKAVVFDFFEEYCARNHDFTSEEFVVHRILLGAGIYLVEHATNLAALRGGNAHLYAAFYKLADCDGATARLFAVLED